MLTKFKLVNTAGLKGVFFKGDVIPFEKIDDTLAEKLIGKTHVLERVTAAPAAAPVAAAVVAELPAASAEASPDDAKKKE